MRGLPMGALVDGVRKIAVLRAGALGDFIFALPAFDALRAAYPRAEIVLLGKRWMGELLRGRPSPIDRVVAVPLARGVGAPEDATEDAAALDEFFAAMRSERFDLALQLHGGGRYSNPFVAMLGARVTAGLRASNASALDRTMPYVYHQSERMRVLEAVALVGAAPVTIAPKPSAWFPPIRSPSCCCNRAAPTPGGAGRPSASPYSPTRSRSSVPASPSTEAPTRPRSWATFVVPCTTMPSILPASCRCAGSRG